MDQLDKSCCHKETITVITYTTGESLNCIQYSSIQQSVQHSHPIWYVWICTTIRSQIVKEIKGTMRMNHSQTTHALEYNTRVAVVCLLCEWCTKHSSCSCLCICVLCKIVLKFPSPQRNRILWAQFCLTACTRPLHLSLNFSAHRLYTSWPGCWTHSD